eukprot:CAMPEP_0118647282 /NCGR_PEP_ID=MMETSP0785-20121206/8521_1 /TAXON_ID=91992 /ORGANISM="Bolidomonas pacifica, Strain CCMP 1866" /LENGTH=245 /DNA_ID=CAMNT_0006539361 /DNA_START=126 /DNA_END=860 /DNA_ORIENTATION=+
MPRSSSSKTWRQLLSANIFIPVLCCILLIIDFPSVLVPTPFLVSTSCSTIEAASSTTCWNLPLKYAVLSVEPNSKIQITDEDGKTKQHLTEANLAISRPIPTSLSSLTALDLILPFLTLSSTKTTILKSRRPPTTPDSIKPGMTVYQLPGISTRMPSLLSFGSITSDKVLVEPNSIVTSATLLLMPGPRTLSTKTVTKATILGVLRLNVEVTCEETVRVKVFKGKGNKVDIGEVNCEVTSVKGAW